MQECEHIFHAYMNATHGIDTTRENERVKKVLLRIMTDINDGKVPKGVILKDMNVKQMNNLALNIARDVFRGQNNSSQNNSSQNNSNQNNSNQNNSNQNNSNQNNSTQYNSTQNNLSQYNSTQNNLSQNNLSQKSGDVFTRPLPSFENVARPLLTSSDSRQVSVDLERILHERKGPDSGSIPKNELPQAAREVPMNEEDIEKRLAVFRDLPEKPLNSQNYQFEKNENSLNSLNSQFQNSRNSQFEKSHFEKNENSQFEKNENSQFAKFQKSTPLFELRVDIRERFMNLGGFDRRWYDERHRYAYRMDLARTLQSVSAMMTTCVIVPMDLSGTFNYPYLTMHVEGAEVYESKVKGAFAVLTFDKSYKSSNGRTYIVLKPVQQECIKYDPPMKSLDHLQITLTKPNGALLSNVEDNYGLDKVQYDASNRMYIKVILNKYFDTCDFRKGDSLYIRNAKMNEQESNALTEFLNRSEGHDVVEVGQANDIGYSCTLYILAPGELDTNLGTITLDDDIIRALEMCSNGCITGDVLNASLQMVITMKVTENAS